MDEEEQAARLGVDVYIVKLVGRAWDLRELIPPEDWSRYQTIEPRNPVLDKWQNVDSAIRAWISSLGGWIPGIHVPKTVENRSVSMVSVVYIPNAGGKSFISTRFKKCLDMDIPVYRVVGWTERNVRFDDGIKTHLRECEVSILEAIKNEQPVLLSQWSPWLLDSAVKNLRIKAELCYYVVDEEVRKARLEEREWSEEKVSEYLKWARDNVNEAISLGWSEIKTWQEIVHKAGYVWM